MLLLQLVKFLLEVLIGFLVKLRHLLELSKFLLQPSVLAL